MESDTPPTLNGTPRGGRRKWQHGGQDDMKAEKVGVTSGNLFEYLKYIGFTMSP